MYKRTLKLLKDPEYIQFLVSPEKKKIIIKGSSEKETGAQKIYWTTLIDKRQCCEFYSKPFVEALKANFYKDNDNKTFRMIGDYRSRYNFVIFDFTESIPILNEPEAEETPCTETQDTDMLCTS